MLSRYLRRVLLVGLFILVFLSVGIYLSIGPSLACHFPARGPAQAGTSARTLVSGGMKRCYLLYTPPGYNPTQPAPVVFSLHGLAGTPGGLRKMTGWNNVADIGSFLVVYPQGSSFPLRWNSGPGLNVEHIDDVQFMRDIITNLSEVASVDPTRIYVTGFSNGGEMAHRIACDLADRIAAVGIVSAMGPIGQECNPSRPVPVMAFYGTGELAFADTTDTTWLLKLVNVDPRPPIEDYFEAFEGWIESWVSRNGCALSPETIPATGDTSGILYTGCNEGAEVILYTIDSGGHTWPGGWNLPLFGKTSTDINASTTMWEFFETHPLKNKP